MEWPKSIKYSLDLHINSRTTLVWKKANELRNVRIKLVQNKRLLSLRINSKCNIFLYVIHKLFTLVYP